ncbi:MAG TPA: hypothetical protein VFI79_18400 [Gemmatimonadales bacterium]|nr:hypothetical protein [Gemmatimonadales bacterium]
MPYDVSVSAASGWDIRLREPLEWFALQPVLRPTAGGPLLYAPDLQDCRLWEHLPSLNPSAIRSATNDLRDLSECNTASELAILENGLYAACHGNDVSGASQNIRTAAARFSQLFPTGSVDLLLKRRTWLTAPALIRTLGRVATLPASEIRDMIATDHDQAGVDHFDLKPRPYFGVSLLLERTSMNGLVIGSLEYDIIFDFGRPFKLVRDGEHLHRLRGEGMEDITSVHHRLDASLTSIESDATERLWMRVWLTRRLAELFSTLVYLGSYASRNSMIIDPISQWADLCTVRDLTVLVGRLSVADDPTLVALLTFDILDRYCAMSGRHIAQLLQQKFLKRISEAMALERGGVISRIRRMFDEARRTLVDSVWQGVLAGSIRAGEEIAITDRSGRTKIMSREQFAAGLIGALRNTTHGFNLSDYQCEQFFMRHSGVFPMELRDVAIGLFWGFLICPQAFLERRVRVGLLEPVAWL